MSVSIEKTQHFDELYKLSSDAKYVEIMIENKIFGEIIEYETNY